MSSQKMAPEDLIRAVQRRAEKTFAQIEGDLRYAIESSELGSELLNQNGYPLARNLQSVKGFEEAKAKIIQKYADKLMNELLEKLDIVRELGIEIEQHKAEEILLPSGTNRVFENIPNLRADFPELWAAIMDDAQIAKPVSDKQDVIIVQGANDLHCQFNFVGNFNTGERWTYIGIIKVTPDESK